MARKPRDYKAEELRRNLKYQARGFTSRAEARRKRERNEYPAEREIQENTERAVVLLDRIRQYLESPEHQEKIAKSRARGNEQRKPAPVTFTERPQGVPETGRSYRDEKSHQWSLAHSRKERSRFHDDWPEERKQAYYDAFVDGWNLPADERPDLYDYLVEYWDFDPDPDSGDWAGYR